MSSIVSNINNLVVKDIDKNTKYIINKNNSDINNKNTSNLNIKNNTTLSTKNNTTLSTNEAKSIYGQLIILHVVDMQIYNNKIIVNTPDDCYLITQKSLFEYYQGFIKAINKLDILPCYIEFGLHKGYPYADVYPAEFTENIFDVEMLYYDLIDKYKLISNGTNMVSALETVLSPIEIILIRRKNNDETRKLYKFIDEVVGKKYANRNNDNINNPTDLQYYFRRISKLISTHVLRPILEKQVINITDD